AGRAKPGDPVDHSVGIEFHKKTGDIVRLGESLATVHAGSREKLEEAQRLYQEAVVLGPRRPPKQPLVYGLIR
ncbi:MAG TPA: thymidine phosphorylase, partial [Elusimicrobiota bacterium]|nr:thymidine phosphorylase [Elusimicrobiota bacterium]